MLDSLKSEEKRRKINRPKKDHEEENFETPPREPWKRKRRSCIMYYIYTSIFKESVQK